MNFLFIFTKKHFFQNGETGSKKNSASKSDLPKSRSDVAVQNGSGNEPSIEDAEEEDEEEATMPIEIEWGETEETESSRRLKIEVVNDHGKGSFINDVTQIWTFLFLYLPPPSVTLKLLFYL